MINKLVLTRLKINYLSLWTFRFQRFFSFFFFFHSIFRRKIIYLKYNSQSLSAFLKIQYFVWLSTALPSFSGTLLVRINRVVIKWHLSPFKWKLFDSHRCAENSQFKRFGIQGYYFFFILKLRIPDYIFKVIESQTNITLNWHLHSLFIALLILLTMSDSNVGQ